MSSKKNKGKTNSRIKKIAKLLPLEAARWWLNCPRPEKLESALATLEKFDPVKINEENHTLWNGALYPCSSLLSSILKRRAGLLSSASVRIGKEVGWWSDLTKAPKKERPLFAETGNWYSTHLWAVGAKPECSDMNEYELDLEKAFHLSLGSSKSLPKRPKNSSQKSNICTCQRYSKK